MEVSESENEDIGCNRLLKLLNQVENRVETLRDDALNIQREKESILELLQDMQDNSTTQNLSKADQEDIECHTERLIIRCLTVEVSVSTPRNESQEEAYHIVSGIIDKLQADIDSDHENLMKQRPLVESYLNASLPEPLSANINHRFQDKLLGCTAEDQKKFRKILQCMLKRIQDSHQCNGHVNDVNNSAEEVDQDGKNAKNDEIDGNETSLKFLPL